MATSKFSDSLGDVLASCRDLRASEENFKKSLRLLLYRTHVLFDGDRRRVLIPVSDSRHAVDVLVVVHTRVGPSRPERVLVPKSRFLYRERHRVGP